MAVNCGTPAPETMRVVQMEPGPMPTLMPSRPRSISSRARFIGSDIARDELNVGQSFLHRFTASMTRMLWRVRRIDRDHVHLAAHQFLGAFEEIAGGPDGRADPQAALLVLGGVGVFQFLLDVLNGDEALEVVMLVHHQQLFHAVPVQDFLGLFERGAHRDGDEVFLRHHVLDRQIEAGFETQIAVGENADQFAVAGNGNAGDAVALHEREGVGDFLFGRDGDRVHDHAAFTALYAVHLFGLPAMRHVAVNEADAALLRERDGEVRFGNRIHGGADDGNVQRNTAG